MARWLHGYMANEKSNQPFNHSTIQPSDYDYLLCRIDEILPGDEVLSLNEGQWDRRGSLSEDQDNTGSGTLQYARINALKDMDIREVYELTTKSGRKIRTTANHPYLVQTENNPVVSKGKINI